jgi:hypothetical protein
MSQPLQVFQYQAADKHGNSTYTLTTPLNKDTPLLSSEDAISTLDKLTNFEEAKTQATTLLKKLCDSATDHAAAAYKLGLWMEKRGWVWPTSGTQYSVLEAGKKETQRKLTLLNGIEALYPEAADVVKDPHSIWIEWPSEVMGVRPILPGRELLAEVLAFCKLGKEKGMTFRQLASYLNNSMYDRVSNPGPGKRTTLKFLRGDVEKAKNTLLEKKPDDTIREITRAQWEAAVKDRGAIHKHDGYLLVYDASTQGGKNLLKKENEDRKVQKSRTRTGTLSPPRQHAPLPPLPGGNSQPGSRRNTPAVSRENSANTQLSEAGRQISNLSITSTLTQLSDDKIIELYRGANPDVTHLMDLRSEQTEKTSGAEAAAQIIRDNGTRAICTCTDRVRSLLKRVEGNKPLMPAEKAKLLRVVREGCGNLTAVEMIKKKSICWVHTKRIAHCCGLIVSEAGLTFQALLNRVITIAKGSSLGDMPKDPRYSNWFLASQRPAEMRNLLGVYAFTPSQRLKDSTHFRLPLPQVERLTQNLMAVLPGFNMAQWDDEGTINLPVFKWLRDARNGTGITKNLSLLDLMRAEVEIYHWHERTVTLPRNSNLGWIRNMYHSLGQQLMRMDPVYYCLYVVLRPDHATHLISYPYYAKRAKPNDKTGFRHMDINIRSAVAQNRGIEQIQGTLSLDDEDEYGCTEVLPRMHKPNMLKQWIGLMEKRKCMPGDGHVNGILPEHWTSEEEKILKTRWTKVPCKAGDVRVSQPTLPHGSTDKNSKMKLRRTLLPWYVRIQDDGETLEIPESGTYSALAEAHREKIGGPSTPSGHTVRYGKIPYRFPAAVELDSLNAVGAALVGRCNWRSIQCIAWQANYMGTYTTAAQFTKMVNDYRTAMEERFRARFAEFLQFEEVAFGEMSIIQALKINPRMELLSNFEQACRDIYSKRPTEVQVTTEDKEWNEGDNKLVEDVHAMTKGGSSSGMTLRSRK